MKKDMDLARRIRGDRNIDFVDRQPKTGDEQFLSLPYRTDPTKSAQLKAQVARMWAQSTLAMVELNKYN